MVLLVSPVRQLLDVIVRCSVVGSSQSYEKRLLVSSCFSVRPHGKSRLPLEGRRRNNIQMEELTFADVMK